MALLFCDGFDHYDTAHMYEKWNVSSATITNHGREGQCANIGSISLNWPSQSATTIVGFAFQVAGGYNANRFCTLYQVGNEQVYLFSNWDNSIGIYNSNNQQIAVTAAGVLSSTQYQYIEWKVVYGTAGSSVIRVNGVVVLNASPLNTVGQNPPWANGLNIAGIGGSANLDDFYLCDGTGTLNNDFLGDIKVVTALPNGNGRVNQFARTGGTSAGNYTAVSEVPPDDDTSYVSSSTAGQIDAYKISSIGTVAAVKAVQIVASARKDDAGTRVLGLGFGNGTTENYDAGTSLGNGYTMIRRTLDQNPLTSAPWAVTDLATAQIAVEEIS